MRFVSDISLWLLFPALGLAILVAFYLYRNESWVKELPKTKRFGLIALRSSGIFLLILLLFGILFESVVYRVEKPVFINLIDNSSSMKNYQDSNSISPTINTYQKQLTEKLSKKFDIINYTVGANVTENGTVNFQEGKSDLHKGFKELHEIFYNRNIGGIAFFSDGNFNQGPSPIYSADKLSLTSVFTIGVGDTIDKKDQYIKGVICNEIAFYKNTFPVEVDIEAVKVGKSKARVTIFQNGKEIASQQVIFENGIYDYKHVSFLINADKTGHQQYTVRVSKTQGEYNYSNNTRNFYVEVLDSRNKVLILAGAPHPDVAALKQVIQRDENIEVKSTLIKEWNQDLTDIDLIVWHEPGVNFDLGSANKLLESKIPILYCIGTNTMAQAIRKLGLPFDIPYGTQVDESQPALNKGFQQFEISSELQKAFSYYPPLKVKFGEIKLSPGVDVLLYQRIGSVQKNDPLIFFWKDKQIKYGVIYGEGIWRWKLNDYVRTSEQANFTELIQKVTQFLVVKQNTSNLRVSLPKRFTKDDEVLVKAEFYNESMELITTPQIELITRNENNKVSKYQFGINDNFYKLNLGKLKPGKYEWTANCKHNTKKFTKSGVFLVEDIQLENLDTRANHTLLNQIATNSKGAFYKLSNIDQLIQDLENREDMVEISYREASFMDLIDYKWLFFCVIIIFGAEWFFRRWLGAY
jgi:hypothetical protein